jgi:hypothetical protein
MISIILCGEVKNTSPSRMREKFGENLVCVRYRYDTDAKWMVKTVELRIDERPWEPKGGHIPVNKRVAVRVEYEEARLRSLVKSVGGKWDREKKCWMMPYGEVLALGLENRLI